MSDVANANTADVVRKDRLRVACFRLVVDDRSVAVAFSEVEQLVAASSCVELSLGLLNDMLIGDVIQRRTGYFFGSSKDITDNLDEIYLIDARD
jgi:hypothetical protein